MNIVIGLGVCCVAFIAGGSWLYLWRLYLTRTDTSQTHARVALPTSAPAPPPSAHQAAGGRSVAFSQHRWSGPRPGLKLTEKGLCSTGQPIRFCLDCAAEKTEERPFIETEPN